MKLATSSEIFPGPLREPAPDRLLLVQRATRLCRTNCQRLCGHGVELMKRYSNPVYQGRRLRRMVEMAEKSAKKQVRTPEPVVLVQRVDRRMSAETIAELVQAYRDGVPTTRLRERYALSQGSVIKLLHEHGVEMRGQGLADSDVSAAAELYRGGMTLAQLGNRFGVSPNAVRRALVAAGVVMRARGGSKPRGQTKQRSEQGAGETDTNSTRTACRHSHCFLRELIAGRGILLPAIIHVRDGTTQRKRP
jgi:hypothetical protein